jgi:hypothetical protein
VQGPRQGHYFECAVGTTKKDCPAIKTSRAHGCFRENMQDAAACALIATIFYTCMLARACAPERGACSHVCCMGGLPSLSLLSHVPQALTLSAYTQCILLLTHTIHRVILRVRLVTAASQRY